jgi:5-methylcytosine-specific restriction endonuclease McrA
MSPIGPKRPRLHLDSAEYDCLRQQVLRRDGWRCQWCGTMLNLEVHHKQFRNHSGDDSEENLVTVCRSCHSEFHNVTSTRKSRTVPD